MLVAFLMGFACGLPLLLTISLLQAWMKEEGVDLTVIGMMALVGLPYTLKFLWAPFLDRFTLPALGRRRGWLLVAQVALIFCIAGLGITDPGNNPWNVAFAAFLVTFFSASQDIVVDAYRREDLPDEELGLGSSLYVNGYRIGMLLSSGGGLILADHLSFSRVYLIMANYGQKYRDYINGKYVKRDLDLDYYQLNVLLSYKLKLLNKNRLSSSILLGPYWGLL